MSMKINKRVVSDVLNTMYQKESNTCSLEVEKFNTGQKNASAWMYSWGRVELLPSIADKLGIELSNC